MKANLVEPRRTLLVAGMFFVFFPATRSWLGFVETWQGLAAAMSLRLGIHHTQAIFCAAVGQETVLLSMDYLLRAKLAS